MTATATVSARLSSIDDTTTMLARAGYIATRPIATAVCLAHHLQKPVLIEGPAGVGKSELAVRAARGLSHPLLRLQCYEGLDDSKALYEWKYGKQLLYTQVLKEKIGLLMDKTDTLEGALAKLAGFDGRAEMDHTLAGYVRALRAAGVEVCTAETIDAVRAVALLGYAHRSDLKNMLGLTLAKSALDQHIHERVFDLYFSTPESAGEPSDDHLQAALARAAAAAGVEHMQLFTQAAPLAQQILQALGIDALHAQRLQLMGDDGAAVQPSAQAQALQTTRAALQRAGRACEPRP